MAKGRVVVCVATEFRIATGDWTSVKRRRAGLRGVNAGVPRRLVGGTEAKLPAADRPIRMIIGVLPSQVSFDLRIAPAIPHYALAGVSIP